MKHKTLKTIKSLYRAARKQVLSVLSWLEQRIRPVQLDMSNVRPVFIIGAPRSGSTLLYQCMIEAFDLAYLTNLHARLYTNPSFAEKLVKPFRRFHRGEFNSKHGRTKGLLGPSEAGNYWYRFFRKTPQFVSTKDTDPKLMVKMKYSLLKLEKAAGKPVLFKNLPISVRLEPIIQAFPKAIFIVNHRDMTENAISILESRYRAMQRYDQWWSVEPPCRPDFENALPHIQVVEQIKDIYREIDKARGGAASNRFLDVSYADLCNNPRETMRQIKKHLENNGVTARLNPDSVPENFVRHERKEKGHPFENEIKTYLQQI